MTHKESGRKERKAMLERILKDLQATCGDLSKPNFAFAEERYKKDIHGTVVRDLMVRFFVKNLTDLNDDVSYQLHVKGRQSEWIVWLSLVGPYALITRISGDPPRMGAPESSSIRSEDSEESDLKDVLGRNNLLLLDRSVAESPVSIALFNTEPENTKVYQALFSDRDVLPWSWSD